MHVQRLTLLSNFLTKLHYSHPQKFDLKHWRKGEYGNVFSDASDEVLYKDCGSTACAVGWACSIPEFKEAGLHYYHEKGYVGVPRFKGMQGEAAVSAFFELDDHEVQYLFMPHCYLGENTSALAVANRIRSMVAAPAPKTNWRPISEIPEDWKPAKMFLAKAIDVQILKSVDGNPYTSDPYVVFRDHQGRFLRWPHRFDPTHFAEIPE